MSSLTPDVLVIAAGTITSLSRPQHAESITLEIGDMRREIATIDDSVSTLSKHLSILFFGITNRS